MVQLQILSGKKAGTKVVARLFPFQIGRSPKVHLSLDEPGVWENHFQIMPPSSEGFVLATDPNTSVVVNGTNVKQIALQNGDLIEIGLLKIRFSLEATRQNALKIRERLMWSALVIFSIGQIGLIYWLLQF
jgi:pSer/pThr/pTyr-binding forkhead associated (FHA) protein